MTFINMTTMTIKTSISLTKEEFTSNIGPIPPNCIIFQNNIAKMNQTMEDARKGALAIGRIQDIKPERSRRNTHNYGRP